MRMRNSPLRSEAGEQEIVISWCALNERQYPELQCIYHIPNGGHRDAAEAVHLKRQGVKAGVPDLSLPVPKGKYSGLFIEMKYGRNKETENQRDWLLRLQAQGNFAAVCYSAERAIETIQKYLALKPGQGMPYLPEPTKGYPILKEQEKG